MSTVTSANLSVTMSRAPPGFLDNWTVQVFELVVTVGVTQALCAVGLFLNVVNVAVFCRQGFADSINVSLCALAFSDSCSLLTQQVINICAYPWLDGDWGAPVEPRELMYLTGGWPHLCFSRISSWITAYVTFERCLCVALPLRVKRYLTPRVALAAMVSIHVTLVGSIMTEYATLYLDWVWTPARNASVLRLIGRPSRARVEGVAHLVSFLTQFLSFVAVVVFTAVLVVKLRQTSEKRRRLTGGGGGVAAETKHGNGVDSDDIGDTTSGACVVEGSPADAAAGRVISASRTRAAKNTNDSRSKSAPESRVPRKSAKAGDKGTGGSGGGNKRERKTVKMIVLLASVFIVCFTPSTVAFLCVTLFHEFSVYGRYRNAWLLVWSGCFALEAFNASVNFALYYHMSSRFQDTLRQILPCLCGGPLARSSQHEKL